MTAPACEHCNNSLSDAEELFRVLVMAGDAVLTTAGKTLWDQRVGPSLRSDRRGFRTYIRQSIVLADVVNGEGEPISKYPVLEADHDRIVSVVEKIAKGLYYAETQEPLPPNVNVQFEFEQFSPERFFEGKLRDAIAVAVKTQFGNGNAVTFWRKTDPEDPRQSLTWICFYEKNFVFLITFTPEFIDNSECNNSLTEELGA
jgi:hypothetical protein